MRTCTKCGKKKTDDLFKWLAKYKLTGTCISCKNEMDRLGYRKYRDERLKYFSEMKYRDPEHYKLIRKGNNKVNSIKRFGFDKYAIIKPESECIECGISNEEHLETYKRKGVGLPLSIHHVDGCGRASMRRGEKPNNDPKNLVLVCQSCHTRIHNSQRDYTGNGFKVWATRRKRYGLSGTRPRAIAMTN